MCAPRWHSDAVFASLIGGGGIYAVTPASSFVWGGYYEEGSLIWRSRWITPEGIIECREALAFPALPTASSCSARSSPGKPPRRSRSSSIRGRVRPARPTIGPPRGRRSLDGPDRRAIPALVRGRGSGPGPPERPGVAAGDEPDRAAGREPGPRAGNLPEARGGRAAGRRHAVARYPRGVGAGRAAPRRRDRRPRCPAGPGGAARPDQFRGRDGRRRHDQPARAGEGRPQL